AEEREAQALFVVGKRRGLIGTVVDLALDDLALARAARAVAAAVRQHQVRGHRRRQHGVAFVAGERMAAGDYGNLVRHDGRTTATTSMILEAPPRRGGYGWREGDPGS